MTTSQSKFESIGGEEWDFSDEIYLKLTGKSIFSNYNPKIPVMIKEIPDLIKEKKIFMLRWGMPTFKDIDCNYLLHAYDNEDIEYIVTTSSGNTVEGMARVLRKYNEEKSAVLKGILLVPALSSFKVSNSAFQNNPYVKLVELKNSTLDSIRDFASKIVKKLGSSHNVIIADADLKTAAYAQMGLYLNKHDLLDDICFVQTVSGGVGPAGVIEASRKLDRKPEILVVQTTNGPSSPIIDALEEDLKGGDPFSLLEKVNYETASFETTLGSTKPIYAIKKYLEWKSGGGRVIGVRVSEEELYQDREDILKCLLGVGVYPNEDIALRYFNLERSGFIAFVGVLNSIKDIRSKNIVINYTGRYKDPVVIFPEVAKPHISFDPEEGIDSFLRQLNWN
ncbi:MAG: hypothetical protein JW891_12950 [Candidatus Lokiarchaeota archaeon]|nr:hypothetical protein [Candidatus Lokiarchaeota archaeon]